MKRRLPRASQRAVTTDRHVWSRIGPRLFVSVMVPVIALSAVGIAGVARLNEDARAVSAVAAAVTRVGRTLRLYAGLVDEKSGSESIVIAAAYHLSPAEVSRLTGFDVASQLRSARSEMDAALAEGSGIVLGRRAAALMALRTRIDAGVAHEAGVRSFFIDLIDVAQSAWLAQIHELTQMSLETVRSSEIRRAISGLTDTVDAFIYGTKMTWAAASLTAQGVPGGSTGARDLEAAHALYERAAVALATDLGGSGAATWNRLIVTDPDVKAFQHFVIRLREHPSTTAAGTTIPEVAQTFHSGLIFQGHLRKAVDAAATDVQSLARRLRRDTDAARNRYLVALGLIAGLTAALAIVTAHSLVSPLRRLAVRASEVSAGSIDNPPLEPSGPYEVAMVTTAFNEVVTNLSALDTITLALAEADFENPALAQSLPGRIGESLRHSVETLKRSIRGNEDLLETMQVSETRFRELADRSPDVVFRVTRDPQARIEYLSPSFETLTGIPVEAAKADFGVLAAALDREGRTALEDAARGRNFQPQIDMTLRRADGSLAVFELHVVEVPNGLHGIARDVTEIRALQATLAEQAMRDPLTGLANRRLLDELLGRALRRANRLGTPLAVAFLDLDAFKSVNDDYGHEAGDTVLRETAIRLQAAVRDADVVARYGGDEFIVVYEIANERELQHLQQRIEDALSRPIDIGNGVEVRCRPSIGMADSRGTATTAAELIAVADRAMLAAKRDRTRSPRPVRIRVP